jgi:hypothetical protein
MKELLEKFEFLKENCHSIELDRDAAIQLDSKYRVYLDTNPGYPQVKIIAPNGEDFDTLDKRIDASQHLPILAIHDNYSFYHQFNDNTYTFPLTKQNFEFLKALLASKRGFKILEDYFQELQQNIAKTFEQRYQNSAGYQLFKNIVDYGMYLSNEEPLVAINDIHGISHMEQVKNLQTRLMSDGITPCFFDDYDRLIFNDLLKPIFTKTLEKKGLGSIEDTMAAYYARKQYNTDDRLHAAKKQNAEDFLGKHTDIFITAVQLNNQFENIFVDYTLPAFQCQNAVYGRQTSNNQEFNDRLAKDKFLSGLSLPSHSDIVKYLEGARESVVNYRWTILADSSPDSDLDHLGWQWHLYYQKVDEQLRKVFEDMGGHELLASSDKTSHVLMIPYPYYTLLVLLHHLKMKLSENIIEKILSVISEYHLSSVPEVLIKEIEKTDESSAQRFYDMHQTRLMDINVQRRLYSLELAQSKVQELQNNSKLDQVDSLFRIPVYDERNACYQTIIISGICEQILLEFMNSLDKTQAEQFTMDAVIEKRAISERNTLTELNQKIDLWLQSEDNENKKDIDIPYLMEMDGVSFFHIDKNLQDNASFEQKRKLYRALKDVDNMRDIHSIFLIRNLELESPPSKTSFFQSINDENTNEQNHSLKCCTIS